MFQLTYFSPRVKGGNFSRISATDGLSSCIHRLRLATVLSIAAISLDFFGFSLAHSSCSSGIIVFFIFCCNCNVIFRLDGVLTGGSGCSFSPSSSLGRLRLTVFAGALRFLNFLRICCFHDPYIIRENHYIQYTYQTYSHMHVHTHSHTHTHTRTHAHTHTHTPLTYPFPYESFKTGYFWTSSFETAVYSSLLGYAQSWYHGTQMEVTTSHLRASVISPFSRRSMVALENLSGILKLRLSSTL